MEGADRLAAADVLGMRLLVDIHKLLQDRLPVVDPASELLHPHICADSLFKQYCNVVCPWVKIPDSTSPVLELLNSDDG